MNPLQQRRRQLAVSSAGALVLTALIVILVNVLANWLFVRWDMTSSGAYSLSVSSKRLMRHLDDRVIIKAYFTPDLPDPYNSYGRYVRDMLSEYRAASHGRLKYEFMPTSPAPAFEKQATDAGMLPIQFEQMGSDQLQIRRGFMGLAIFYRDHTEVLPVVRDIQGLEYAITSRISKMAQKSKKVIMFSSGHGEVDLRHDQNSKLAQDLSQLYEMHDLSLLPATTAAFNADALFVVGPRAKFDDKALWVIDQAVMRGIPTAFLVDAKNIMLNRFIAAPLDLGLGDFLKNFGVTLGDRLVYDAQSEPVGITQNVGGMAFTSSIRYPYIPMISQFDPLPILQGLESVAIPFPVTVDPVPGLPKDLHFTPILQSSAKSWLSTPQTYNISPTNIPQPQMDEPHGPYILGGLIEGHFTSFFQGKPLPFPGQALIGTSPQTQVLVLGTSHVLDPSMPDFPGMEALVSNFMAYMAHDETLIGIRSKGEILRPLKPISSAPVRDAIKIFCILGIAALPALWGLYRWRSREHWRQIIGVGFASKTVASAAASLSLPE